MADSNMSQYVLQMTRCPHDDYNFFNIHIHIHISTQSFKSPSTSCQPGRLSKWRGSQPSTSQPSLTASRHVHLFLCSLIHLLSRSPLLLLLLCPSSIHQRVCSRLDSANTQRFCKLQREETFTHLLGLSSSLHFFFISKAEKPTRFVLHHTRENVGIQP